ncbi:helix-turn-helix domain-containing protein [Roseibium polysiphoniae]|uniref:Helix-turn-helix transcriptional regulator n=1 Tax=Roseibium polysiphoniae TaxID=2571221 RepID=A0ABR9C897_9HYPH|nr:LuxR C-terminal-related transcriptional regulator [Roseibium polysiphoniae]MBD8875749.1 helix-turn-helix transcriptional regulator [Roseibium polysiphoniae]
MKSKFDQVVRAALDVWSSGAPDQKVSATADVLRYVKLADLPGLNLHVLDMQEESPDRFRIENLIERTDQLREGCRFLGDYPDPIFIRDNVAPVYATARDSRHPIVDTVEAKANSRYFIYDRLILPEKKTSGRSSWAIGFTLPRLVLPLPVETPKLTARETEVLDMILLGRTAREIAERLELSQRTVEHRILDLRTKYGAKNVTHLTALAVSTRLRGKTEGQ